MPGPVKTTNRTDTYLKILIMLIIAAGILVRLLVYIQNRNLIIDEANIARNLHERGFAALALPLSYEQYAPPVFLWIEKLNTLLFGFSEYALRLYPLITGIASLFVMLLLLRKLMPYKAQWYPLLLFATAHILIRYSSEVKQYMPDVFITLSLLLLALTIDIKRYALLKFLLLWFVLGSVAVWSCMPSVFILAGVGFYYGWTCLSGKLYKQLAVLAVTGFLWITQFAFYYFTILAPQANSDYLQNFHQHNFLFATPGNSGEWMHNWAVFAALLKQFGKWPFMLTVHTIFLIAGATWLFRRNIAMGLLFLVPVLCLLAAAALNQFSLLPRVALFSVPILIIITGCGFYSALQVRVREWRMAMTVLALYCVAGNISQSLQSPYKYEELLDGLAYAQKKGIAGPNLYLYHSSIPTFIYYTQIHPGAGKLDYRPGNVNLLKWDTPYAALSWNISYENRETSHVAFVFTNAGQALASQKATEVRRFMRETGRYDTEAVQVFIYQK